MADDQQYGSRVDNKRKYDDPVAAAALPRRPTGFSSAPPVASPSPDKGSVPPPSYNSMPPPPTTDPIQLAKQRAQEVAARLFNDAEAKRPRFENGAGGAAADDGTAKGFGASATDYYYKSPVQNTPSSYGGSTPTSYPSYGYPGANKKIDIPNGRVGVIIGKGGETIKYLQLQSGAKIQVTRDADADPSSQTRAVELVGTDEQVSKAEQLIKDVLEQAEAGGPPSAASGRSFEASQPGAEHFTMKIPNHKVGLIIGKGGETIKSMQARSGAHIQVVPLHLPPGDPTTERDLHIDGNSEQIETAKQLVAEIMNSDTRGRNTSGYRPPRPQASWAPPGQPMQQPGYGYMQPGAYPGAPPQYNVQQPSYGGYPSQPMPGYAGWDQTGNTTQQAAPAQSYDYSQQGQQQQAPNAHQGYGQQPTDNTAYNYGQAPYANYNQQGSYGDTTYAQQSAAQQQGYGQDGGYSGGYSAPPPLSGYAQPPSNAAPGYNQNTYSSASYPNNQDGSTTTYAAQGTPSTAPAPTASQSPASTQGYATQPVAGTPGYPQAPGYGAPPTSQATYGSQPVAPTSYGQPAPVTQPPYGQTSPAQKPSPSPGYSQAQYSSSQPAAPGYTAPSGYASGPQQGYGQQQSYASAAPQGQAAGYGQQPQQQPPYTDPYASASGGYAAQPQYAGGDNSVAGSAAPAGPPATGIKASPQAQS